MSGYNSWLTTCALWRRIVDLIRKPAVALLDWCQGGIRRLGLTGPCRSWTRSPWTYQQTRTDKQGRWRLTKTYVSDPARSTVLLDLQFEVISGGP